MEYSNKNLKDIAKKKKEYNPKYAKWYYRMYCENGGILSYFEQDGYEFYEPDKDDLVSLYLYRRGLRINYCMDLWEWDKYEKNKILDLQRVNRCMNHKFCPNCKVLNVSRFIHEFRAIMPSLLEKYDFYMLTLTIPSIKDDGDGVNIDNTLKLLSQNFQKLNRKYSAPLLTPTGRKSSQALQDRYFFMSGGIRVLEITYSYNYGFHPHFHCIVLVPKNSIDEYLLEASKKGKYSRKRKSYNYWSEVELQLGKAWTLLWNNISFRKWDKYDFVPSETYLKYNGEKTQFKNLEIDFAPLDEEGIYEVFKYTFKDTDVVNYNVFKSLVYGLDGKRIRQGFGVLYNFKCEEFDEGEAQPLELAVPEEPVKLLTTEIKQLYTEYESYKKISRFNKGDINEVMNSIAD